MTKRKKKNEESLKRIAFLAIVAALFWVVIFARLFQIQIIERGKYVEKAKNQYIYQAELKPVRGIILDRKSRYLAINRSTWSLGVDVSRVDDPDSAAFYFSRIFNKNRNFYLERLQKEKSFFWLARGVDENIVSQIENLKITGVRVLKEPRRYYPQNKVGAHLIGFTDVDLKGLSGVELIKNKTLQGNQGYTMYQKDAFGKTIMDVTYTEKRPEKGKNVVLTVDNTYQWIAEEELSYVIENLNADAATAIITNPATGEILAMAVKPDFDPNNPGQYSPATWRNRAITDSYEPGSTFKPIVMSAILEEGIKSPDDLVFCENGKYQVYDRTIEDVKGYGWLTLETIIKKSSNIGMAKIAKDVNKNLIYQFVRDYGLGVRTDIELPGETSGDLKKTTEWSKFTPISLSYGYEISVTPIQMAMAFGAIANGGFLLKPKIYLGTTEDSNKKLEAAQPTVIRRVISESTSRTMISMLEDVVADGTGKEASIPGLRIAGKTGTTKKYDPQIQRYSDNKFVSSFIGFYPADSPKLLIYIMVDNPRKAYLGGQVAAPAFRRILQRILRVMEIDNPSISQPVTVVASSDSGNGKTIIAPNLVHKRLEIAEDLADQVGFKLLIENQGDFIVGQQPGPGTRIEIGDQITVRLKEFNIEQGKFTEVPDVTGLALREAIARVSRQGLRVVVQGSGKVKRQIPSAGNKIRVGARCVLQCEPAYDLAEYRSW